MHAAAPIRREQLIESHLPLVRSLARGFTLRGEPLDDLIQAGCVGLIHAADRFDASRGHAFEAFAAATITGEIRHHLRDRSSVVRVPTRVAEQRARIYRARGAFEARTGRTPTTTELAREADVLPAVAAEALAPVRVRTLDDADAPADDPITRLQETLALHAAIRTLPPRERRIVVLSFYGERSQRRVADDVGLSQIHVSRLLRSALARLRVALEDDAPVAHCAEDA